MLLRGWGRYSCISAYHREKLRAKGPNAAATAIVTARAQRVAARRARLAATTATSTGPTPSTGPAPKELPPVVLGAMMHRAVGLTDQGQGRYRRSPFVIVRLEDAAGALVGRCVLFKCFVHLTS